MTKEKVMNVVNYEIEQNKKIAKQVKKANTWQQNNSAINSTMNVGVITDVNGDDVTQLCKDDIVDNYGVEDNLQAMNNAQNNIHDDYNMNDKEALADDKKSYKSLCNNVMSLDWAEDTGMHHGTDNYYTDVSTKTVLAWLHDMAEIIKGNSEADAEA